MRMVEWLRRGIAGALLMGAFGAWAQTTQTPPAPAPTNPKNVVPGFAGLDSRDKVLLMPVDVELFSLSAGGVPEPKADWTAAAHGHMKAALQARKSALKLSTIEGSEELGDEFAEQVGLHAAVAQSIALHHAAGGVWALPTKNAQLLWSFGDAMQPLAAKTGARYGLFMWVRDSYASAERKAMMVGLALLGVGLTGGIQVGYASLVDLQDGRVVWFNRLARGTGDLRDAASATESVDALLAGFPQAR